MAAVTICSDLGTQKYKVCYCFHCFPICLPWSDGTRGHDLSLVCFYHQFWFGGSPVCLFVFLLSLFFSFLLLLLFVYWFVFWLLGFVFITCWGLCVSVFFFCIFVPVLLLSTLGFACLVFFLFLPHHTACGVMVPRRWVRSSCRGSFKFRLLDHQRSPENTSWHELCRGPHSAPRPSSTQLPTSNSAGCLRPNSHQEKHSPLHQQKWDNREICYRWRSKVNTYKTK